MVGRGSYHVFVDLVLVVEAGAGLGREVSALLCRLDITVVGPVGIVEGVLLVGAVLLEKVVGS